MEMTSYAPGTPSWVDLGSPDPNAAGEFYAALFGWEIVDLGEEAGGYRMCEIGGKPVAGIGPQMQPDVPPWWTTYIAVDDAEAAAAAVTAAGGQILAPPFDVMTAGRMAVAMDPTGATFSMWQTGDHPGAGLVNEPGALTWNELTTRQTAEAVAFYGTVFGWTPSEQDVGGFTYTTFLLGDHPVAGMMPMDDHFPPDLPSHWMVYFAVADTDASVARVVELGGQLCVPATDIAPGRFAVVADPHGAMFSIIAPPPA